MSDKSKVVVGVRVYERVKMELYKRATEVGKSTSSYAGDLLTCHCEEGASPNAEQPNNDNSDIEKLKEENQLLRAKLAETQEQSNQSQEGAIDQNEIIEKYNQLSGKFGQQRLYIQQLEERVKSGLVPSDNSLALRLSNKDRFFLQLQKLSKKCPDLNQNELVELVVSCCLHNESAFFLHGLKEHLRKNADFFNLNTSDHA